MPPDQHWFCIIQGTLAFVGITNVVLLLISMTFERFFSIMLPHKAASFNTVKRAKITIIGIVVGSIIFNVPHHYWKFTITRKIHHAPSDFKGSL